MIHTILVLLFLFIAQLLAVETMPIHEIRPGMTGYGLSVFHGNKIERFNIEIIDILKGFVPGGDIILARCTSSYAGYNLEKSGLIAGMSGSPVYIDGKMIGAIAYGWPQAKETMAGITPIQDMLKIAKRPIAGNIDSASWQASSNLENGLVPVATPLVLTGGNWKTIEKIQKAFAKHGLVVTLGGTSTSGGQENDTNENRVQPGSAVGAQLMSGDLDMTAIGTVTWTNDEEVLAFGHPFLGAGSVQMPFTSAHISTVLMNHEISFKLGNPKKQIGTLYHDRNAGIYGKMGIQCPMIPVEIELQNVSEKQTRTFHVRIIKHPLIAMLLVNAAIENFLTAEEPILGEHTLSFSAQIWLNGKKEPIVYESQDVGLAKIGTDFSDPIQKIIQNPFQRMNLEKLQYKVVLSQKLQYAKIVSARTTHYEVKPGEALRLEVVIQPYYGKEEVIEILFPISKNAVQGIQPLIIASGDKITLPQFSAETNEQYWDNVQMSNQYQARHLVVGLASPQLKILCENQTLENLPRSIISNLLVTNETKKIQLIPNTQTISKQSNYVLQGVLQLLINIKDTIGERYDYED